MDDDSKDIWMDVREACLLIVGAIERKFKIYPLTADLRKEKKQDDKNKRNGSQD
jgi:hypothetical protein